MPQFKKNNEEYLQSGARSEIYSDFLQSFIPHPNTGQITRKTNVDAVKMSIRNLILTNKYERLRNPRLGGNVRRYLFEPMTPETSFEVKQEIQMIIDNYEPRAKVIEIKVTPDEEKNTLYVSIEFYVITSEEPQKVDITLYRVR